MRTPAPSPSPVSEHQQTDAMQADPQALDSDAELTHEEAAALATHHRHISETSYLPAQADYLHVR